MLTLIVLLSFYKDIGCQIWMEKIIMSSL